jgi:signal peptidase I
MSSSEKTTAEEKSSKQEPKSIFREYFESLVTTLVMALFGMTFIIQAVTVPTGSMQNTIMINDYFLVNKFIFSPKSSFLPFLPQRDIERGDIVVFKYPGFRDGKTNHGDPPAYQTNYIKRVIGLPGEKVEFKDNQVFIDGKLLPEHRLVSPDPRSATTSITANEIEPKKPDEKWSVTYSQNSMDEIADKQSVTEQMKYGVAGGKMEVPENNYLVMGDNRDNSTDGRFWGFLPRELIVGQALFVYWSCEGSDKTGSCLTSPRLSRIGHIIQ